jgi:hypothetical protein
MRKSQSAPKRIYKRAADMSTVSFGRPERANARRLPRIPGHSRRSSARDKRSRLSSVRRTIAEAYRFRPRAGARTAPRGQHRI